MQILIIGGTNFIGLHTANEFIAHGHDVTVFHRNQYTGSDLSTKVKHILGNRSNYMELSEVIKRIDPDMILDMYAMCEQDVFILEKALFKRTRVLVVSSLDVYEAYSVFSNPALQPLPLPLNENSKLRTVWFPYRGKFDFPFSYDYEKILVERAALNSNKMDTVIVRLGMIYGENDPNHRFRPFIEQLTHNSEITLSKAMGNWIASKGYVRDIAYGLYLAGCKGNGGEIYNLAEQNPVSEAEWLKRLALLTNWNGTIKINGDDISETNWDQDLIIDTTKIRSTLGYSERYTVEQALKNTFMWENQNFTTR